MSHTPPGLRRRPRVTNAPQGYTLRADHDAYLCAEEGGAPEGTLIPLPDGSARQGGLLTATRETAGAWETFTPEAGPDGTVGLRSSGGFLACCENGGLDGVIVFRSTSLGAWEQFRPHVEESGAEVSFEAVCRPGFFIKAWPDGRVSLDQPMWEGAPTDVPGGYETFRVDPPIRTGSVAARPPVGMARISGRGFADDAGAFLPIVATHMDAIYARQADPTRCADNLDYLASLGFHQRVLGILGWEDEEVDPRDPNYWGALFAVLDEAYAKGIRTELTVLADLYLVPELQSHDRRMRYAPFVVDQLYSRRHMLLGIEGCNEPGNGDLYSHFGTPEQLVEFTRTVGEGLGVPWAAGALYGGNDSTTAWWRPDGSIAPEAQTLIAGCPAVSMHFDRGVGAEGLWRPVRQPWEGKNTAEQKQFWDNEPVGYQSSVTSYDDDNSGTAMHPDTVTLHRVAAVASFMAGAGFFCFHTEGGTGYSSNRPIRGEKGGPEVAAALAILPPDLPNWDKHNWHWTSNPVETLEGCIYDHGMAGRGTLRTISATSGVDVLTHPFCSPEGATLRARWAMQLDQFDYREGRYQKVGELHLSAGQTWEHPRSFDMVYKGRLL